MENMCTMIPKGAIPEAMTYAVEHIRQHRTTRRPFRVFGISKCHKFDNRFGTGSTSAFHSIPLHLLLDDIRYEITDNAVFWVGGGG